MSSTRLTKKELVERASKQLLQEVSLFYASPSSLRSHDHIYSLRPDANLRNILKAVRDDSVAWSGITTLIDRTMEAGWIVRNPVTSERDFGAERFLKNKGFDFWLREMLLHYFVFSNAFGEIVYGAKTIKELHTVDPTQIQIVTDEHGGLLRYEQHHGMSDAGVVVWQPSEILHVTDPHLGQSLWGEIAFSKLYQAVSIRYHVKKLIHWLFATNQFRGVYNPKAADVESVKRFITFLKESEQNISKPIIVDGEFEYHVVRSMQDLNVLNALLYKMDEEILNLLQVPPIYAGLPDNSNRSNSDAQERAFNTRIKSVHLLFKHHLDILLKRAGLFKREFVFRPVSNRAIKEIVETAQIMKSISMSDEAIEYYLRNQGLDFPNTGLFVEEQKNDLLTEAQAPSRRRKGEGELSKQVGTGDDATTREEQVSRASFARYPYVYDAIQD